MTEHENTKTAGAPEGPERPGDGAGGEPRANLVDLYEKMSKALRENLERAGTYTEEAFEAALRESKDWAQRMREAYSDDITKVSEFIRRDWHEAVRISRDQASKTLDFERLQVGMLGFLMRMAQTAGSQLEGFASRLNERLTYKTGEIAGAGTLDCNQCHQQLLIEKPTRIPPCPKCRGTVFRRSY